MTDYTPNIKLVIPVDDQTPWSEDMDGNLSIIDAFIGQFMALPGMKGTWKNATGYLVNDITVDKAAATIWQCNIANTSATTPTTFATERANHPDYWTQIGGADFLVPDALKKSGDTADGLITFRGGVSFGDIIASSLSDLSDHITFHSSGFGINYTTNALNLVATGASGVIHHIHDGVTILQSSTTGASVTGNFGVTGTVNFGGLLHYVGNTGWTYNGLPGTGNAIGFTWDGTNVHTWVDGVDKGVII